jgi:phenylacetate-CoA ligase
LIPRTLYYLAKLKRNLNAEFSELEKMQLKTLRTVVKHAYENVHFYHTKFDEAGLKPSDVRSLDDISKLPITTKSEIQASDFGEIVARNSELYKCTKRTTSGSTGLPLTLYVNQETDDYEKAVWARTFMDNGLSLHEKMAVMTDPRSFPEERFFQRFGLMRRKYISIFDSVEKQFSQLQSYKPEAIKGYPSSLFLMADAYTDSSFRPRLVFTSAEQLDKMTRNYINSSFQVNLFDNYGCNEFGLLAWECKEHLGYHINIDRAIVEFVEDGQPVDSNEPGEIVCTSLINKAMPLIRYKTDDVGIPIDEKCPCGKTLPIMKIIHGRKDDFLMSTEGRLLSPTIFFPYPFDDLKGIVQFKVVQTEINEMMIQIAVNDNFMKSTVFFDKARSEIQRVFGNDMQVYFEILDSIRKESNGKIRKVVSMLPKNTIALRSA